ncbi:pentatricopeptide repeat-containing protein At4g18975, chloroplastic isoform X2 [Pistacia vera]|uniref:pentatricopeptide repeat-containing protein At4g18975, chloroplastic isoform X2 n=1 Tax=Pistacia vera TaxID=55513 RepID=UPI001263DB6C|nr:pentatricopeptide repeat-containing protein At4g18975, chloroplastic isoform X2 [Pistacia vera]
MIKTTQVAPFMGFGFSNCRTSLLQSTTGFTVFTMKVRIIPSVKCHLYQNGQLNSNSEASNKKIIKKVRKKEQHLWKKRESTGSGKKALNLVRIVSELPNEKEAVYGALDKWTAWETEFPLIATAKALNMLRQRGQWRRVIQVAKWMLSKGQGATMGTYDTLLLAFDKDQRADEAESLWNMILHTHSRSISKRLFSRMISLYDHHDMLDKIIDVFADMEELGVKPDEDTVQRVARAFRKLGEEEKRKLVLEKYQCRWKYIHFKGERVKVRRDLWDYDGSTN